MCADLLVSNRKLGLIFVPGSECSCHRYLTTVKMALELGRKVGRIWRIMPENASISLNALLGIWTLKTLTPNRSKGNKIHVIGNWKELWQNFVLTLLWGQDSQVICLDVVMYFMTMLWSTIDHQYDGISIGIWWHWNLLVVLCNHRCLF